MHCHSILEAVVKKGSVQVLSLIKETVMILTEFR